MSEQDDANDVRALKLLMSEIQATRLRVYRNLIDEPYISHETAATEEPSSSPPGSRHLLDKDTRSWLTIFTWEAEGILLHEREVDRILEALAGYSLRFGSGTITDPALLSFIDKEPVVVAVLEFMHSLPRTQSKRETTMAELWKVLHAFAVERNLTSRGRNRFPGGPNVLSRKLRHFAPILEKLGIRVTIVRSNGSKVTLLRLDEPEEQSSTESSKHNVVGPHDLASQDSRTQILEFLSSKQGNSLE